MFVPSKAIPAGCAHGEGAEGRAGRRQLGDACRRVGDPHVRAVEGDGRGGWPTVKVPRVVPAGDSSVTVGSPLTTHMFVPSKAIPPGSARTRKEPRDSAPCSAGCCAGSEEALARPGSQGSDGCKGREAELGGGWAGVAGTRCAVAVRRAARLARGRSADVRCTRLCGFATGSLPVAGSRGCVPPEHEGLPHPLPRGQFSQTPPLHLPSVPQVDAGVAVHTPRGSVVPSVTEAQFPLRPPVSAAEHAWHAPSQGLSQQKPSTQKLPWHWLLAVHRAPWELELLALKDKERLDEEFVRHRDELVDDLEVVDKDGASVIVNQVGLELLAPP